ncbi:MAG: hypothetical protein ACXW1A_05320 [Nitrososphaeraceae archaeon]
MIISDPDQSKLESSMTYFYETIINKGVLKMLGIISGFVYKYFFDAIIVFAVGMFTSALVKQFGSDRALKIKETILQAMLFAEEKWGLGSGDQKWTEAWKKIIELLGKQGITLKTKEISYVQDLMKSAVPEINAITYSSLPDNLKSTRNIKIAIPESKVLLAKLREKYPEMSE